MTSLPPNKTRHLLNSPDGAYMVRIFPDLGNGCSEVHNSMHQEEPDEADFWHFAIKSEGQINVAGWDWQSDCITEVFSAMVVEFRPINLQTLEIG